MIKRRILLVDDDLAALLTLKAVLELNHFEVHTAASSAEAMEKLDHGNYQMVITDSRMETEDAGFHVLRAARRQSYNPATALLTSYPPHKAERESFGPQTILVKPVGTEDVLRQIEALLVTHEDEKQMADARRGNGLVAKGMRRNTARHQKKPV